ncbi:ParA family protein [Bacteroides cellulosilyticus]|uniref:ParA family protein n=4 Tax=Bacteroidaceae TaxID=815 RepID=A0A5M6A434_9BACE|nr:ParA family protein [Bacteroides cellulosilyticus]KAA3927381.1 ParA family protein [Bacteroides ovatus]KAB4457107.1 ParA family protein [Bacteroides thetaiotaomicron]CDE87367.1 putative ParA-related protein [Prevotella sp. CAG:891]KAA3930446.1 ParA family protein [Bacteroides ovatus]KAA5404546.1 ParA family protein [Bacteroides cellulosilyticus]
MIQTPVIVTFANQKGGVGKTSLCVTFANYLVMKGVRVVVIDCDFQHSILKCRKADLKHYGEELIPYEVWSHEPNSSEAMITLIEKLHNDPGIDVVLMDSPGSLKADGLVPMFVNSDIIAVPFHYDLVTVPSTASFLMFLDRLRKAVGSRMKARLFIIPNLHDNRVGKRTELLLWDNTRDTFSNYGYVTSKISRRADLQRFSTIAGLDLAQAAVTPVFDKIYDSIFDTLEPLRKVELTGIQLSENLSPKSGKKKYQAADSPVILAGDETEEAEAGDSNNDNQPNQ